ncbi:hypothetical protein ACQR0Z_15140 [Bradyrhizobium sp. HKCCYLS3077]|uniref:hypothetical protein n=1 Tax=Bradyrhizobium sp. HKCCYLS3077 TaxID=3420761 RepID=UPI003EBD8F5E
MVAEVAVGLAALKSAFDLTKGLKDIDDRVRLNDARLLLQEKILDAQQAQSELLGRVEQLEKEVRGLKDWTEDKKRYVLSQLRENVLVYSLRPDLANGEPSHSLCPDCYSSHYKSVLVGQTWSPGRCQVLVCNGCGWVAYLTGMAVPEHRKLRPEPYEGPAPR